MMTTSNEHNNAPAVPQGWKLVPVEPTRAMWAAVNKLDDEMAAGSYDGKGCSIEQAWNCMLDFAPDAPALAATPAPAPAQTDGRDMFKGMLERSLNDQFLPAIEAIMWVFDAWSESADLRTTVTAPAHEVRKLTLERDLLLNKCRELEAQLMFDEPAQDAGLTDEEIDENTVWHDPDPHDNVHCDVSATVRKCLAALHAKGGK